MIERTKAGMIWSGEDIVSPIGRLTGQLWEDYCDSVVENKHMANLLWEFIQNTDENASANLSILHRAAYKFAVKGDG
jgi:hypothetical protein